MKEERWRSEKKEMMDRIERLEKRLEERGEEERGQKGRGK